MPQVRDGSRQPRLLLELLLLQAIPPADMRVVALFQTPTLIEWFSGIRSNNDGKRHRLQRTTCEDSA